MKLFGHHVGRLFALFIAIDGALFIVLTRLLSTGGACLRCGLEPSIDLQFHQAMGLTAAFLLTTTSVGVYNSDATQHFGVFLKRFILAAPVILVGAVAALAISRPPGGLLGWRAATPLLEVMALLLLLALLRVPLVWRSSLAFLRKRVMVYGDGQMADAVAAFVEGPGQNHFRLVRAVGASRPERSVITTIGNLTLKPNGVQLLPLLTLAQELKAEEIVVAVEDRRGLPVEELLECRLRGIDVVDALTFWEREAGQIDFAHAGPGWLTFSGGFAFDQRHRLFKRIFDVAISLAFLIFMLPVALLVALAIRLESRGPIFYRQERVGLNGQVFSLWKFRSMRADAERDGVPRWANSSDDRITRVGRFIRLVRLDEMPQILNVLTGDMSFIGPRPERPFFVEQLKQQIPYYDLRHRVRPGITGWAQVNYPYGASIEDARRKLSYDLYYLKRNDLVLDFAILLQTVRVVLFAHGAR